MALATLAHCRRALAVGPASGGRLAGFGVCLSYLLAGGAAVVRIVGPLLWTSSPLVALSVAGTLFSIAYAVFLYDFIPVLLIKTSKQ